MNADGQKGQGLTQAKSMPRLLHQHHKDGERERKKDGERRDREREKVIESRSVRKRISRQINDTSRGRVASPPALVSSIFSSRDQHHAGFKFVS